MQDILVSIELAFAHGIEDGDDTLLLASKAQPFQVLLVLGLINHLALQLRFLVLLRNLVQVGEQVGHRLGPLEVVLLVLPRLDVYRCECANMRVLGHFPLLSLLLSGILVEEELQVFLVLGDRAVGSCYHIPEKISGFVEPKHREQVLLASELQLVEELLVHYMVNACLPGDGFVHEL
jgi:hypothetical protein